jgi:8-oxo-dGTP pyrophosphatase MutT (NUDIX family)
VQQPCSHPAETTGFKQPPIGHEHDIRPFCPPAPDNPKAQIGERRTGCDLTRDCPGHHYAVLPGGHVEEGETAETAALRELNEETTLTARIDRLLWTSTHNGRPASYFLMTEVSGTPVLSGSEAEAHCPEDSFELMWAGVDDFEELGLYPADVRLRLTELFGVSA